MNRTGKIALLPRPLRDELNRRLEQNVPGRTLTSWLNSLPEVQAILATYFHGDPINQQNLSNWRRGGFAEWQARQDFFDGLRHLAEDAADIEATLGPIADQAARMAALQFALLLDPSRAIRGTTSTSTSTAAPGHAPAPSFTSEAIKSLCQITRAIATLRRGDLAAARFKAETASSRSLKNEEIHPRQTKSENANAIANTTDSPSRPAPSSIPPPGPAGKSENNSTVRPFLIPLPRHWSGPAVPLSFTTPAAGSDRLFSASRTDSRLTNQGQSSHFKPHEVSPVRSRMHPSPFTLPL